MTGNPFTSRDSLAAALRSACSTSPSTPTSPSCGSLRIQRVGTDRYGRTLATVSVNGRDLSCHQLAARQAIYKPAWDNGGRVIARCRSAATAGR